MGGFMFNGCGAADSYYKLKDLPHQKCGSCKDKHYALMELRRKIRVLYIPTFTLNTKYAVVCTDCKNGFYVTDEQKNFILNNPAECVEVCQEGLVIHGMGSIPSAEKPPVQEAPESQNTDAFVDVQDTAAEPRSIRGITTCKCGAQLAPGDVFCAYCGTKVQTLEGSEKTAEVQQPSATLNASEIELETKSGFVGNQASSNVNKGVTLPPLRKRKVCPSCRMMFAPEKEVCGICGGKLVDKK